MPQAATIKSPTAAFAMMKVIQAAGGLEWARTISRAPVRR